MTEAASGIDGFISRFIKGLEKNAVDITRFDHYEKALRLKSWHAKEMQGILGASHSEIPFDEIQQMHAQLSRSGAALTNELAGKVQGRTEREREQGVSTNGVSILSEKARHRDRGAAMSALRDLKRDTINGWTACDLRAA